MSESYPATERRLRRQGDDPPKKLPPAVRCAECGWSDDRGERARCPRCAHSIWEPVVPRDLRAELLGHADALTAARVTLAAALDRLVWSIDPGSPTPEAVRRIGRAVAALTDAAARLSRPQEHQ